MTIIDNQGFIIGPINFKPVNEHDTTILPEAFTGLITLAIELARYLPEIRSQL